MELDDLYQEIILDHSKKPRNYGELANATAHAHGDNPACGDEIDVHLLLNDQDVVQDIRFTGQGCAISQASASMMTLKIKGKTKEEALDMLQSFQHMLIDANEPKELPKTFGELKLLKSIRKFPQRVKCATLAWQALKQALS
ncbi:MAG: Fe-S cluster assembly sulfur transfer protein SufU [Verrucomicrobiota bacterium]